MLKPKPAVAIVGAGFAEGVGQLVWGVRELCQEVDQLNLALRDGLQAGEDGFKPIGGTPLTRKRDPERQIVRTWYGRLYAPHSATTIEIEEEPEAEDEVDDGEESTTPRRKRRPPVKLGQGDYLLATKLILSEADGRRGEPRLQYAVLGDWQCGLETEHRRRPIFEVRRGMLRRLLRHLPMSLASANQRASTTAKARVLGQAGKTKGRPLSYRCLGGLREIPLFEFHSANALDRVVRAIKKHWASTARRHLPAAPRRSRKRAK